MKWGRGLVLGRRLFLGGCGWVFGGFFLLFSPSSSPICPLFSPLQEFHQLESKPPKSPFAPPFFPPPPLPPPISNPPTPQQASTKPNKSSKLLTSPYVTNTEDIHHRKKRMNGKNREEKEKEKEKEEKL